MITQFYRNSFDQRRMLSGANVRRILGIGYTTRENKTLHRRTDVHQDSSLKFLPNLPVQTDLLEKYRGLVTLGRIQYDEEQIRAIMKLRRLQKELIGYAPPGHSAKFLYSYASANSEKPWWLSSEKGAGLDTSGRSLVTFRGHAEELGVLDTPKGLLLTGPPGSGKSFLVDLWYESVPTQYKTRKHYGQLVLEIYRAVWEETQQRMSNAPTREKNVYEQPPTPWNKNIRANIQQLLKRGLLPMRWGNTKFSIPYSDQTIAFVVAKKLLLRHWLLVFDEIQLLDVSSATLLAEVLSWYWRMGGIIVGTSNKVPDDLYRNGVQRERLEPFVEALKIRCLVLILDGKIDWRELSNVSPSEPTGRSWYTLDQKSNFEAALKEIIPAEGAIFVVSTSINLIKLKYCSAEPTTRDLRVFGRLLTIPWVSGLSCKFSFSELCNKSLGPADYLTIASHFSTIIITDVPTLPLASKDQARRFISLIDALYESRCRIVCLAETTPDKLFFPDASAFTSNGDLKDDSNRLQVDMMMAEAVAETQDIYRPNVSSYDQPRMRDAPAPPKISLSIDGLSIFSGEEEQFAFRRALSRLWEMTSVGYNAVNQWTPLPLNDRKWETDSSLTAVKLKRGDDTFTSRSMIVAKSSQPGPSLSLSNSTPKGKGGGMGTETEIEMETEAETETQTETEDFASEASYETVLNPSFTGRRPPPPRVSPDHIWGVREDWGPGAKEWGQGADKYRRGAGTGPLADKIRNDMKRQDEDIKDDQRG